MKKPSPKLQNRNVDTMQPAAVWKWPVSDAVIKKKTIKLRMDYNNIIKLYDFLLLLILLNNITFQGKASSREYYKIQ